MRPQRWQPTRLPCPLDSLDKNTGVGFHVLVQCMKVKSESEVTQSCLTLSDPMDCSLPGSSIHGIFQARVLEWVGIAFSEKTLTTWKESDDQSRQHAKKQRRYFANKDLSGQGYDFSNSHIWMWELDYKESWVLKNWCFWTVVLEKTQRLLRVPWTARRSNQSILKEISPEKWKGWCWSWNSSTLTTWWEEPTLWKRPWCWERLKAGREGDDRGWYGWMASSTQWAWVWVNSGSWWWTGRPGVLQSTGSRRVGHKWGTELSSLWAPDSEHVATTSGQRLLSRFQCQPTWRPVSLGLQWIPDHIKSIQVRTRWCAGSPSRVSLQSISIYTKCIYKTTRLALFSFPHFATS